MEFGRRKKPKIPYSKTDLKQAVVNANKRLKKANDKLDKDISTKKKSLLSVNKEISSHNKEIKSILSDKASAKHDTVEARSEAKKEQVKLSKLNTQLTELVSNKDIAQSDLDNLNKESRILNSKINKMNDDLAKASTIKEEIKILKSDKKIETKELEQIVKEANGIRKDLSKLRSESVKKKKSHKELLAKLDAETETKQESLSVVDKEYTIKMAELNAKLRGLTDHYKEQEQEASVMDSLVSKRELDYIEIESKYKQAENALMYTKSLTNKEIDREKSAIHKIREDFKRWKIGALEEIARLKLKKKIENIDKAGLTEILNG